MRFLSTPRGRWYLVAALWLALIVLGIGGFLQQSREGGLGRSILDNLYLTAQLATLDYKGGDDALNWRLEVSRFVAPLIGAGTLLQAASVVFRDQFERFRLRFARGHTVVCGLGESGSRLAAALTKAGQRVVAIEPDRSAVGISSAREHGITVLVGDASEPEMLAAARVDRAAQLVALCGADATNVEIAATARKVDRPGGQAALRCSVHLTDSDLCALLRSGDLDARGEVRVAFFNLHEAAARAWLAEHPPFGDGSRPPHPVVLGLGQLGRSLVIALAQRWADTGDGGPLHVTLLDRTATGRWDAMRLQHPALAEVCRPELLDLDLEAPTAEAVDTFTTVLTDGRPTSVAVAFDDETLALSSALFVHQTMRDHSVPVVVRARTAAGLTGLLSPPDPDDRPPFPGMSLFPFLDRTCTRDAIEGGVREQLARAVHEDYLAHTGLGDGLRRRWDELDDDQRDLSRSRVDGIIGDLDALRCDLVPLRRWGVHPTTFTEHEVETLAEREHERWSADRKAAGWTHGPVRDDSAKRNPLLVAWSELTGDARDMNLDAARALPAMLARAGFEPVRRDARRL